MSENRSTEFVHTPYIPYDRDVEMYSAFLGNAVPWDFTGLKDEVMSWKTTAYIHASLNPGQAYRISGPDTMRLFSENAVNSIAKWEIGQAKHLVMCNEDGLVMVHGVAVRMGEDDVMTHWLQPWIDFLAESGDYDVVTENLTGKRFLFQIGGPRSLDVVEAATGESLRDIRFLRQRESTIAGVTVDVLRLGMAGSLAYEVHGPAEKSREVYAAIVEAGEQFGLRRLGMAHYILNHTENGFPQGHQDFLFPWFIDPRLHAHMAKAGLGNPSKTRLQGSAGEDITLRFRTPVDLGWGNLINFDHDFRGRAALEKAVAERKRTMVTLAWNADDVLDVYRSQLEGGEEYTHMKWDQELHLDNHADLVLVDGKTVGISTGRGYSYYYRQMISVCSIDTEYTEIGTEVVVLWGNPGSRQKEIRATVERFPYYNENRNETVDVATLTTE